jgi:cell division transport system permease protein
MFILLAVSVFLISITVLNGVNVRFEEIRIMKLIGATDAFIKAPFIVEGIIIGLIGAILPLLILYPAYQKIVSYFLERFGSYIPKNMGFVPSGEIFATLIPISLVVGIGIGLMGTWLTLKRKLSVLY